MIPGRPPTLEEYRALDLRRPLTDDEIGVASARKRAVDAELSAVVTPNPGFVPPKSATHRRNHGPVAPGKEKP